MAECGSATKVTCDWLNVLSLNLGGNVTISGGLPAVIVAWYFSASILLKCETRRLPIGLSDWIFNESSFRLILMGSLSLSRIDKVRFCAEWLSADSCVAFGVNWLFCVLIADWSTVTILCTGSERLPCSSIATALIV